MIKRVVIAGAIARLVSALVGFGFHARDDYFHVLEPALAWLRDPGFDWAHSDLPAAGLRSELVPRVVQGLVALCARLGITEPESVLRALHAVFGAYSLLGIVGVGLLASRLLGRREAQIATWLAALHFAMPYLGTRLLIEAVAIPPLLFGMWLVTFEDGRRVFFGGLLIGLACWFRYQVGVAALGVAGVLLWQRRYRDVAHLAVGGLLAVAAQGAFDLWTTGRWFGPLLANIAYNSAPPGTLTRESPLAYVGLFLLLTVPPATFVVVPAMWKAARNIPLVWVPFALFVLAHTLIPHKEERFMAPVLPLFLVMVAAALATVPAWAKRFAPAAGVWFVAVHIVALVLVCTHRSQDAQRSALADLRHDTAATGLISAGPELPTFFLGKLAASRNGEVDAVWMRRAMKALDENGTPANRFVAYREDAFKLGILLEAMALDCPDRRVYEGDLLDTAAYAMNPRHNKRRGPVVVWSCSRPELAMVSP